MKSNPELTRRAWLRYAGLALGSGFFLGCRPGFSLGQSATTVASEKWADFIGVDERTWAVVSKPLSGSFDTVCNGGVVAGSERVLAFDSYAQAKGATWVGEQCESAAGRWPTDIVVSHHHGDHTNGLAGFVRGSERPTLWATEETRTTALATGEDPVREEMLEKVQILPTDEPTQMDLGGRTVTLVPYEGHTVSDMILIADDVDTIFFGDLLWNELFPNYVDAIPSKLAKSVAAMLAERAKTSIPGHGPIPSGDALDRYVAVLEEIEAAARKAHAAGKSLEEATADYQLPESLGSWTLFSPQYFEVAFGAWYKELG